MSQQPAYRTSPDQAATGWPPGVPYIVGNEVCERFSFYGMRTILKGHLVYLFNSYYLAQGLSGETLKQHNESAATSVVHLFFAGVYALSIFGAIVADRLLGKYRTIFWLSLVYCAGHAVLSAFENELMGVYVGLSLIALGSGGIKPCVSANVGDQFGKANWHRVRLIYQIFYFSINLGSFCATMLIPVTKVHSGYWLESWFPSLTAGLEGEARDAYLARLGTSVAFGIPGVLMFLATVIFWMGRKQFVHVPPSPGGMVGLLDTLSSTALFMAAGHFFFTPALMKEAKWDVWAQVATYLLATGGFLALGLWLFAKRQRLMPDDGFLAITLHALRGWVGRRGGGFWQPAVEKYGPEAAEGPRAVFRIMSVFFLVCIFWALFDQKATTWRSQAEAMDLSVWPGADAQLVADQTIAANPLLVMLLIPLMNFAYRQIEKRGVKVKPLPLMTLGMVVTASSFAMTACLQMMIDESPKHSIWIGWQLPQYFLLTVGEVMVSITGLEFAYTQAPKRMKSTVMGFWLLLVALGNVLVVFLAQVRALGVADRFWVYAILMVGAAGLFGLRAWWYTARDYTQG